MIRTCPKCGDYYADALLAFCLVDGTPLIDVAPDSVNLSKAARVIEAKEHTLKKWKRKLKWQRIAVSTMAVATLAMFVAALNALIYIESVPKKEVASPPSIPKASSPALPPPPLVHPDCSVADKPKEENAITDKFGAEWRRKIEGNPPEVKTEKLPTGIIKPTPILGAIKYKSLFLQPCTASITASYLWQVTANFNGQIEVVDKIPGQKKFTCAKTGETWSCR